MMRFHRIAVFVSCFYCFSLSVFSQLIDSTVSHRPQNPEVATAYLVGGPQNLLLSRDHAMINEHYLNLTDSNNQHSSIHPYAFPFWYCKNKEGQELTKITYPSDLRVNLLPVVSTTGSYEFQNAGFFSQSQAGLNITANCWNKLTLSITGLAGRAGFVSYLDSFVHTTKMIPGIGIAYGDAPYYSYQYIAGYLSYSPNKIFNFQVGKDKHFWGDGYRSLLLSDVAGNYPFLKLSATVWKLKYVTMFALLTDAIRANGITSSFNDKYGTFHYLSWNVTKRLNIALFESILFQGSDSNRVRSFDVNYLNPVIFFRPVEYSLGSSDNALLGLNLKLKIFRQQQLYGQLILDEFLFSEVIARKGWWANKQGFQLGFKSTNLFHVTGLSFQTEFNYVRPYTYTHASVQQNYGHLNQSLAHPLGANFMESVSFLTYHKKRWLIEGKCLLAIYGDDTSGVNYGRNIFLSYNQRPAGRDYGNYTTQGVETKLLMTGLRISYAALPAYNLRIEAGATLRTESSSLRSVQIPYVYLGIKTSFMNTYDDF